MPKSLISILLLTLSLASFAQKMGSWRDHFAYTQGVEVMSVQGQVVCATSAGLIFFDGEQPSKISKVNGLSDFGITAAMYDASRQRILLGYDNGNIDIINSVDVSAIREGNRTINISDWKSSRKPGAKRINRFLSVDGKYFVATASRILEISNNEIVADFTINDTGDTLAVVDLALLGNTIVAATSRGLYAIDKSNPQIYNYAAWQRVLSGANIISTVVNSNALYALQSNGTLFSSPDLQTFSNEGSFPNPRVLSVSGGSLWLSTSTELHNVSTQRSIASYGGSYSSFNPYRVCVAQVGTYSAVTCVADLQLGLMALAGTSFLQLIPNGPQQNQVTTLAEQKGKIAAAGNGVISVLEHRGSWINATNSQVVDVSALKIGRQNASEILAATSGGVVRLLHENSTINYADRLLSGSAMSGMDYDRSGNLFAFAAGNITPVKLRGGDGSWSSLSNSTLQSQPLGKVAAAGRVYWGIYGVNQIFAYSAGSTPSDPSDDQSTIFATSPFSVNAIYSIAADRDSKIWLGTDQGVLLYATTTDPFTNTPAVQRVKIPNEIPGRASYLLEFEKVTAVAVDGGNRKWFGTRNAGAFLQSPSGSDEIHAFNISNSPLPSNYVIDITTNSQTGEVIFATDKGMVGYYGEATSGKDAFSDVKVYPNPVRPEMELVTITNLMEDASVRITDMAGNLVFFSTASGGAITWDTKNLNGSRVATGVYLVFLANASGEETKVVKLLVMN